MADYDNTNTGALFKNDKKLDAKHPDYKGSVNVNGQEFWVSAWIKPKKSNPAERFMSLSIKAKDDAPKQAKPAPKGSGFDDMDDDLPF